MILTAVGDHTTYLFNKNGLDINCDQYITFEEAIDHWLNNNNNTLNNTLLQNQPTCRREFTKHVIFC